MKRLYTLAVLAFATLSAFAQLKIVEPTALNTDLNGQTVTVNGTPSDNELDKILWIIRTDNVPRELKCRKTEIDVLLGTSNVTCWKLCPTTYDMAGSNPVAVVAINGLEMTEDLPGADGDTIKSFAAHYKPNGLDGCSLFKYEWFDTGNPSQVILTVMVRFTHNVNTSCTASIESQEKLALNIYPNPASDFLNVSLDNTNPSGDIQLKIIDVLGKTVYSKNNLNPTTQIDLTGLNKGVYFVALYRNGVNIKTEKLIKR